MLEGIPFPIVLYSCDATAMAKKPEEPKKKKKKVAGPKQAKGGNENSVKRVRAIFGQVALGILALSGWMILMMKPGVDTSKSGPTDPAGGSYVLSYFMVLMGIALGLLAVCRPSGRRERAGNAQYGEGDREKMLAEGRES
jgi:hypothetical protein